MSARVVLCAAAIISVALVFVGCDKGGEQTDTRGPIEETAMSEQFEYGSRVDPMTWVESAEGLDAALSGGMRSIGPPRPTTPFFDDLRAATRRPESAPA